MALSIIELIIRKTAVQKNIPESIVEKVIAHKFKEVYEAHSKCRSVEDSGFGTFKIRPKVVGKRIRIIERIIDSLERELQDGTELTDRKRASKQRSIEKLIEDKKYLETKI